MALFKDDQGRTEKPTPSRLADVRQHGDTQMSREFVHAGTMLVAALALRFLGGWLLRSLGQAMTYGLTVDPRQHPLTDG
ncbi:MAG TPA: EscU/YscU/HrcU family type III secretion system export apparatus switch protein, partial [Planctomycetota bacterium]|nr:EscU/YscU/HrcU family type III secretion system export apparatus switch protein [Planctomycetota bacterium]